MTAAVLPPAQWELLRPADRSVGPDAGRLKGVFVAKEASESIAFTQVFRDLESACKAAGRKNWDGYGAEPVDFAAVQRALAFIEVLPATAPPPEVSVDPDGEVAFTWEASRRMIFSVSVGRTDAIGYAGVFGSDSTYGREYFADELPSAVASNLARLYPKGSRQRFV